jgi:ankyrin repeat protein
MIVVRPYCTRKWVGDLRTVCQLPKFGGDLDRKNAMGETALHLAAVSGNLNAVTLLIEFGTGIDQKDRVLNEAWVA